MPHLDKHQLKNDTELVYRLLKEWKEYVGCLNSDAIDYINNNIDKIEHSPDDVIEMKFNTEVGYGYDRFFNKIKSNTLRLIFKNNELVTAYPQFENELPTEEKYNFKNKELLKYCNDIELKSFQSSFFDKFISVLNNNFPIRFIASKNSQIRIYIDKYTLKISENGNMELIDTSKYQKIPITQTILNKEEVKNLTSEQILNIALNITKNEVNIFNINKKQNILENAIKKANPQKDLER